MTGTCIGIDLGTSNMTAYVEGKGIVFSRPSVIACDAYTGKILALGKEALAMTGRTPPSIRVLRPFSEGVISDFALTAAMVKDFVQSVSRLSVMKPNIIAGVPSEMTSVEKKAMLDLLETAGAARACIMEHSYAAALGADLAFTKPSGVMVVDIGGGTVDIAVITMGSIAVSKTLRFGSEALTQDIIRYLRRERDIETGYLTADSVKCILGSAVVRHEEIAVVVKGRNVVTGAPINFEITSTEVYWAVKEHVDAVFEGIRGVLSSASPELCSDVSESGIVLTGGGSLLYGLTDFLESMTGVPVRIAREPFFCVAKGLGKAVHNLSKLKKNGYAFRHFE